MGGERKPPQGRDRAIGAQLRAARLEYTTWSSEQAAREVEWSSATFSRTETGKRHISSEDVAMLLAIYRVPRHIRERMVENAKVGCQTGWWSNDMPGVLPDVGALASYEADARRITNWSANLIPGLLQTRDYAIAFMLAEGIPPENTGALWETRVKRQARLPLIEYSAFIHESVLLRSFGGREAHREQLVHLHRAYERGVGVRIVREMDPALLQSWMLIEFPQATPIVHVELLRSSVYLYDQEVAPYLEAHDRMARNTMTSLESRNVIERVLERL